MALMKTIKETCELLGLKSHSGLRNRIHRYEIPHHIGGYKGREILLDDASIEMLKTCKMRYPKGIKRPYNCAKDIRIELVNECKLKMQDQVYLDKTVNILAEIITERLFK